MATGTIKANVTIKRLFNSLQTISTTEKTVSFTEALDNYNLIMFNASIDTSTAVQTVIGPPSRTSVVINGLKQTNGGTERTMTINIANDKASATAVMSGGTWALDVWGIKI